MSKFIKVILVIIIFWVVGTTASAILTSLVNNRTSGYKERAQAGFMESCATEPKYRSYCNCNYGYLVEHLTDEKFKELDQGTESEIQNNPVAQQAVSECAWLIN
jgi:hypothetical protein